MRLYLKLSPGKNLVNFNYQGLLTGIIHKWLGTNSIHDTPSLYSFSWLGKGKPAGEGLLFPYGSEWFVSFWESKFGLALYDGIKNDPTALAGMEVTEIEIQETPSFENRNLFFAASPVLIRGNENERYKHFIWSDPKADELLTQTLALKLTQAGIKSSGFKVEFDRSYHGAKTKLVRIHNVDNRASVCPVLIEGENEVKQFAWNVGIGHSTGTGFGAIK